MRGGLGRHRSRTGQESACLRECGGSLEGQQAPTVICLDSDLIDLRYPRDRRARRNRTLLDGAGQSGSGATTVFSLLEIVGVVAFNLNEQQLVDFHVHFPTAV